jgi:RNA polymerase sigma-70 factor (ECF subfamily)
MTRLTGSRTPSIGRKRTFRGSLISPLVQEIPLEERTDEALLASHIAGEDGNSFEELLGRYVNELIPFLTRLTGSKAAADDVFQETFLQIHQSARTFDPSRRFRPWLYTIAVNKGRDWHRRNARRKAVSLSNTIGADGDGARMADLLADDGPMPGSQMEISERVGSVKKVVDELPSHLREILLLSYFQRMSYNQIADSLEIPLGTVKSRLHSAVATFGRAWQQHETALTGEND